MDLVAKFLVVIVPILGLLALGMFLGFNVSSVLGSACILLAIVAMATVNIWGYPIFRWMDGE